MTIIANADIAASVLRHCELPPGSSLGDGSPEAQAVAQELPNVIEALLRASDWSFASQLISLPQTTAVAADPSLPYAVRLPDNVLQVQDIEPELQSLPVRWRIDRRLLYADAVPPLLLRVTIRPERESDLPADFRHVVALSCAARLAPQFASSMNRTESLELRADRALQDALRNDRRGASIERWDGRERSFRQGADWVAEVLR